MITNKVPISADPLFIRINIFLFGIYSLVLGAVIFYFTYINYSFSFLSILGFIFSCFIAIFGIILMFYAFYAPKLVIRKFERTDFFSSLNFSGSSGFFETIIMFLFTGLFLVLFYLLTGFISYGITFLIRLFFPLEYSKMKF